MKKLLLFILLMGIVIPAMAELPLLEGIVFDPNGNSYAIANGEVIKVGSEIDGYLVVKITEKEVIYEPIAPEDNTYAKDKQLKQAQEKAKSNEKTAEEKERILKLANIASKLQTYYDKANSVGVSKSERANINSVYNEAAEELR